MDNANEIERVQGTENQVISAENQFAEWFAGDLQRPLALDLTSWRLAYGAVTFGVAWLLVTGRVIQLESHRRRGGSVARL
jgi:hypothetical protein